MGVVQIIMVVLALLSVGLSAVAILRDKPLSWEFAAVAPVDPLGDPLFEMVFDYTAPAGQAHSPSVVDMGDGFSVLWFQGSQEAQADVDIFEARFARGERGWQVSEPARRVTRGALGDAMEPRQLIVTLGNTIEDESAAGSLFATVVSVGGWAMASVAQVGMGPDGPLTARKLNLSPLLNRSHLVKSPMVGYADGSMGLPAYFEMGRMHGVMVRFGRDGRVRDTRRMDGPGLQPIQPMVVPLDASRAVAFLRNFDTTRTKLLISHTDDGGQSWSAVVESAIETPSSPVAALSLGGDRILMAVNDDAGRPGQLSLNLSEDSGESWQVLHRFDGGAGARRYPMLRRLESGEIVLSYSHATKGGIRVHVLNDAWIAAQ